MGFGGRQNLYELAGTAPHPPRRRWFTYLGNLMSTIPETRRIPQKTFVLNKVESLIDAE